MSNTSVAVEAVKQSPIHPGEVLSRELSDAGVSVSALARALDVPHSRMADVVRGERDITADTALGLGTFFGTSARFWLNLQTAYDIAIGQARSGRHAMSTTQPQAA